MSRLHLHPENDVEGCKVFVIDSFEDDRGSFMETFNALDYENAGLPTSWLQTNLSKSFANVIRGLHIQRKNPQGKLLRCVAGAVFDVCLDLRKDSPSFGKWHAEELTAMNKKAIYCPPGTAHGFLALQPSTIIYSCTTLYDKETDGGVFAFDRLLRPHWPIDPTHAIMSDKDRKLPGLNEWLEDPRGTWNE